ncbi:MAG: helicase-related protein [Promethearchaeota archaeon]
MVSSSTDNEIGHNEFIKASGVEFRTYQVEIAKKCVTKNSLVVLPTGLGKTIIAVFVAAYTLELFPQNSKIIILAPTRPLINQHYDTFTKFLTISEEQFVVLTGKVNPEKRAKLFHEHQIILYTPQTLRNDIVRRRYSLNTTCLIVFDEAHHATGDYPYPLIADEYLDQNPDGNILALTASPGASQKKIDTLCESLHILKTHIHTRTRTDGDVKIYLKPMDIYKIGVDLTELMGVTYTIIKALLEERLQYLSQLGFLDKNSKKLAEDIYRKDLLKLNSELVSLLQNNGDKTGVYTALSVNAQTLILYHMIDLIEQQGLDVLLKYLEKMRDDAKKKSSSKAVKLLASEYRLYQLFMELLKYHDFSPENLIHPKYTVLLQILTEQLSSNSDSRILVFVKLRDSVKNITKKLNTLKGINASRFVGQTTKSKDDKGLSQKKQLEILEKFKQGEFNVLVSTNVGEEGLDIAECDLVIFYDVVASEIRFIQRKGRTARHREGKVIILYCKNTHDDIYLKIAMSKLKRMNINLKNHETTQSALPKTSVFQKDQDIPPKENPKVKPIKKTHQPGLLAFMHDSHSNDSHKKVVISKAFPVKFGLRKRFQKEGVQLLINNIEQHIIIYNKVLVQVYCPDKFNGAFQTKLTNFVKRFQDKYRLIIIVLDFIDFAEQISGELRVIKRKVGKFAKESQLRIVPIEDVEELYFIVKNIIENTQKEKDI